MRINVYTYTIYIIVTTIDSRYACDVIIFCFFSSVLSLDIKTILLGIERRRTYNNINVAIETCGVHFEPFEFNVHTCPTGCGKCILYNIIFMYTIQCCTHMHQYYRNVGISIQYNMYNQSYDIIVYSALVF